MLVAPHDHIRLLIREQCRIGTAADSTVLPVRQQRVVCLDDDQY